MTASFSLNAEIRSESGKGASRRLRRLQNRIPAILYGGKEDAVQLSVELRELQHALENEAFYSHILTLNIGGKAHQAILRDLQRHPSKGVPTHADFQRVSATEKLHTKVPLHFINQDTCVGVKRDGGTITHNISEIEVSCLPKDLPEYIEVDMADVAAGTIIHLSDLKLPAGVQSVELSHGASHDQAVATVHKPRTAESEEGAAGAE